MFKTKVYLYDSSQEENGYRGQDFSKYVLQGDQNGEDITQEMDTAELTLAGLSFGKEFDPETKFIIDFVQIEESGVETILETQHKCVSSDIVNQPILSDDNCFDHHISLIEPSVVAQKRVVDNISTTYKLKDVSLQSFPAYPDTQIGITMGGLSAQPTDIFDKVNIEITNETWGFTKWDLHIGKYFQLEGNISILNSNGEIINKQYVDIDDFGEEEQNEARFVVPKLAIYGGVKGTKNFEFMGYASLDYLIEEFNIGEDYNPTQSWSGSFISNSNLRSNTNIYFPYIDEYFNDIAQEWIPETTGVADTSGLTNDIAFKKYTETTASTPTYITQSFPISANKKYKITISLHQFDDNLSTDYAKKYIDTYPTQSAYMFGQTRLAGDYFQPSKNRETKMTNAQVKGETFFVTYNVDSSTIVYQSAFPYSALALLQKAIINSSIYEKVDGTYVADVNKSNLPFYIDPNFVGDLSSTLIIENFYNQKNLWEIMVEVGNYIHSIPELKFGADDRFVITFNRLGRTDEKPSNSTKVSVYNSKNLEEYISATSSYITNMVQLGGYVEEWVSPKTTNEQLLVSNDTAEIIVSKPIIELLQILVKNNTTGEIADLTPFVYEENVYKTLDLDYQLIPNRGIGLYYSLGDNVITGGQFQLPQSNTNIYSDYSLKKVIFSAFYSYPVISPKPTSGYWSNLLIKDYSFFVRYRTKDSVRQNHSRPDLRKYLLNSKYDKFPEHNQFNNQTDVVVDSIKFGNNMYGKLTKTGNSTYETIEWNDNYSNLKHKGELYRLKGELYYVAKVTHYRYSTYILSKITYSKDYNELSAVIGIPSEPRFYEISEQSLIWREFAINDLLLLTDDKEQLQYKSNYVFNFDHLADLVLGEGTDFAKYAITVYKGDKDTSAYDQTVGEPFFYKEVINAVNAYSSENTLTYEWDMIDNYSAGDKVVSIDPNTENADINEKAYSSLRAVGYTDVYGKSALLDFFILGDIGDFTTEQINALPESPISTKKSDITRPFVGDLNLLGTNVMDYDENYNGRGIALLKDCREAMSINFNLQLITNSDTFVLSPYAYLPKKSNVRIVLLAEEVNKLSSGFINNSAVITPIDKNGNTMNPYFDFEITKETATSSWDSSKSVVTNFGIDFASVLEDVADEHFTDTQGYQRVKSIVVLCDVSLNTGIDTDTATIPYKTQFVFARNIPSFWDKTKATSPVYFGAPNKDEIFKNKQ